MCRDHGAIHARPTNGEPADARGSPATIATAGLIALAVAMGTGRFAFMPVMPMMEADAGLTLRAAGFSHRSLTAGDRGASVTPTGCRCFRRGANVLRSVRVSLLLVRCFRPSTG